MPTPAQQRAKRRAKRAKLNKARADILKAVNAFRAQANRDPLYARNINEAVCIARRQGLVGPSTLEVAGFNAR